MASRRKTSTDVGTGSDACPDVSGTEVTSAEEWEAWYRASRIDRRTIGEREADERAAAAARRSKWRRVGTITMGTAAALAVFSSGILYADFRRAPAPADAVAQPASSVVPASSPSPPSPSPSKVFVQAPASVPVVAEPVGTVRGAPPVQLSVPALGIDQRLVGLRVRANRQLDVPESYSDIGWWSTGPVPGDPGAALMVGHLDSREGPAVFSGLPSLAKGAVLSVRRADGTQVRFAVTKVQSFPKDEFPDKIVYRTEGRSSLHLVTCGGTYDPSVGYRDNVVVFADLVKPKQPGKPGGADKTKGTDSPERPTKAKRSAGSKGSGDSSIDVNVAIRKAIEAARDGHRAGAGVRENRRRGD